MRFDTYSLLLCLFISGRLISVKSSEVGKKVGIIGAGIGGTSTAYYLKELFQHQNIKVDVTIFEAEDRIGGRAFNPVFTRPNRPNIPLSMGASLFVSCNYNLMNFTKQFSLPIQKEYGELLANSTADLWNGSEFLWKESPLARYGSENFIKLQNIINSMLYRFLRIYKQDILWTSVEELFKSLELDDMLHLTGYEYFIGQGLSETFVKEYLDFTTRANYARGIKEIHALAASIAAIPVTGACSTHSITSGNSELSKELVIRSKSKILLNQRVRAIFRLLGKYIVLSSNGRIDTFDHVVIATPIHLSKLSLLPKIHYPTVEYTKVQTTHVTGRLKSTYFNITEDSLPTEIYVTSSPGKNLPFNSIYRLANYDSKKIYMHHLQTTGKIHPTTISRIFGDLKEKTVQVLWNAYPKMSTKDIQQKFPVELTPGLYYLNTMEPFISTMETETLSAKNIARLIERRIRGIQGES